MILSEKEDRFKFLTEYTSAKVVEMLMKVHGMSLQEALLTFHNSETFEKLCDIETGLYIESPMFVYSLYLDERKYGTLHGMTE